MNNADILFADNLLKEQQATGTDNSRVFDRAFSHITDFLEEELECRVDVELSYNEYLIDCSTCRNLCNEDWCIQFTVEDLSNYLGILTEKTVYKKFFDSLQNVYDEFDPEEDVLLFVEDRIYNRGQTKTPDVFSLCDNAKDKRSTLCNLCLDFKEKFL
jgi:hypothetical protein